MFVVICILWIIINSKIINLFEYLKLLYCVQCTYIWYKYEIPCLHVQKTTMIFSMKTYWKCNFPMTPHVRLCWSVRLSVRLSYLNIYKGGKLHFHGPIKSSFAIMCGRSAGSSYWRRGHWGRERSARRRWICPGGTRPARTWPHSLPHSTPDPVIGRKYILSTGPVCHL